MRSSPKLPVPQALQAPEAAPSALGCTIITNGLSYGLNPSRLTSCSPKSSSFFSLRALKKSRPRKLNTTLRSVCGGQGPQWNARGCRDGDALKQGFATLESGPKP